MPRQAIHDPVYGGAFAGSETKLTIDAGVLVEVTARMQRTLTQGRLALIGVLPELYTWVVADGYISGRSLPLLSFDFGAS